MSFLRPESQRHPRAGVVPASPSLRLRQEVASGHLRGCSWRERFWGFPHPAVLKPQTPARTGRRRGEQLRESPCAGAQKARRLGRLGARADLPLLAGTAGAAGLCPCVSQTRCLPLISSPRKAKGGRGMEPPRHTGTQPDKGQRSGPVRNAWQPQVWPALHRTPPGWLPSDSLEPPAPPAQPPPPRGGGRGQPPA